jgi:CheY-like chemotaxis protein
VFICDLQLAGDMDGLALARALRSKSGNHRPLLVALTGLGQADDRERSLAAGFDRHFTKPPDLEALRRLIDGLPPPEPA